MKLILPVLAVIFVLAWIMRGKVSMQPITLAQQGMPVDSLSQWVSLEAQAMKDAISGTNTSIDNLIHLGLVDPNAGFGDNGSASYFVYCFPGQSGCNIDARKGVV